MIILITGICGQDGSLLAEDLIAQGHEVHGLIRRSSSFNTSRIDHLYDPPQATHKKLSLHYGDITDSASLRRILSEVLPDEIYHLAAQSHVRLSFDMPEYTVETIVNGTLKLLETIRELQLPCRLYNACSSEIFGSSPPPQHELTPMHPRSPYAAAKAFTYHIVQHHREAYGLFAANGILFNHVSVKQNETFLLRKVSRGVARIARGKQKQLFLGNLDARRDWGWAPEYVVGMQKILRHTEPLDVVVGTGITKSVRDVLDRAFCKIDVVDWEKFVEIDPRYYRATEVDVLQADTTLLRAALGWTPTVTFDEIIDRMVDHDLAQEALSK